MKIFVCIKQVPDTAINIKVSGDNNFDQTGLKYVINPYDEFAIEEANTLKQTQGGEVVVISIGDASAVTNMRSALAMGADRGILVKNDKYFLDSKSIANILKKVIEAEGRPDLILMGRNSIDHEGMQTHYRLAKELNLPIANEITDIKLEGSSMTVEREMGGGVKQVLSIKLPCILGATKGLNVPRYPKLPDILKAKKKEIKEIEISELGCDVTGTLQELTKLEAAKERSAAKIIDGSVPEAVQTLVNILKNEEKVI